MKKMYLILLTLIQIISVNVMAQSSADLDINNIKARFNPAGDLFWDFSQPKFEAPKGSGLHTFFGANLWVGGLDAGNQLKVAAQTYRQNGTDFWPGPIDMVNVTADSAVINSPNWKRVWKINKSTIDSFINYNNTGIPSNYVIPQSIIEWPAHGDISHNHAFNLAPFVDNDLDGVYDPNTGDYPKIRGDQAVYFIYNDVAGIHSESKSAFPIGLEIHVMAYAFNCTGDSALDNTIFLHYDLINRSASQLNVAHIGLWADFDIGHYLDDFIGSDVKRKMMYAFNGDNNDEGFYGTNIAAQSVVFLKGPQVQDLINDGKDSYGTQFVDQNGNLEFSRFMYYNNDASIKGNPDKATDFYN